MEDATRMAADSEVVKLLDELLRAEVLVAYPNQKENGQRKDKRQRRARHAPVAQARGKAKDADISKWLQLSQSLHAEMSWRNKKKLVVMKFGREYAATRKRGGAYEAAAKDVSVTARTVKKWVYDYEANDGFFTESLWGKHASVPWLLCDEDVQSDCRDWIHSHSPKKGEPNFTALGFLIFLIGDKRLNPPTTGLLNSPGPNGERPISNCDASAITDRTATTYLLRL